MIIYFMIGFTVEFYQMANVFSDASPLKLQNENYILPTLRGNRFALAYFHMFAFLRQCIL